MSNRAGFWSGITFSDIASLLHNTLGRKYSYLEWMSRYTPSLWRLRLDLVLLFTISSLLASGICTVLFTISNNNLKFERTTYGPIFEDTVSADDASVADASSDATGAKTVLQTESTPEGCGTIPEGFDDTGFSKVGHTYLQHGQPLHDTSFALKCGKLTPILDNSVLQISTLIASWVLPGLLILVSSYWICRPVRLRHLVGWENRPHFISMAGSFTAIYLPYALFQSDNLPDNMGVYYAIFCGGTAILLISLFVKTVLIDRLVTAIYSAILALGVSAVLIFVFIIGSSIVPTGTMSSAVAIFLIGLLMLLPAILVISGAQRKSQGNFTKLFGCAALWCVAFSAAASIAATFTAFEGITDAGFWGFCLVVLEFVGYLILLEVVSWRLVVQSSLPKKA